MVALPFLHLHMQQEMGWDSKGEEKNVTMEIEKETVGNSRRPENRRENIFFVCGGEKGLKKQRNVNPIIARKNERWELCLLFLMFD